MSDDRYLWPEMLRVIEELRPRWVVGENVAGIVNMALDQVLSDLEGIGYTTQAFIIPACAVDAPHRRDRVCIVGYCANDQRKPPLKKNFRGPYSYAGGICEAIPHTNGFNGRTQRAKREGQPRETGPAYGGNYVRDTTGQRLPDRTDTKVGRPKSESEPERPSGRPAQPGLGGVADGLSHWLDEPLDVPRLAKGMKDRTGRLKCLGNAVVPQQFYPVFMGIAKITGG